MSTRLTCCGMKELTVDISRGTSCEWTGTMKLRHFQAHPPLYLVLSTQGPQYSVV